MVDLAINDAKGLAIAVVVEFVGTEEPTSLVYVFLSNFPVLRDDPRLVWVGFFPLVSSRESSAAFPILLAVDQVKTMSDAPIAIRAKVLDEEVQVEDWPISLFPHVRGVVLNAESPA